MTRGPLKVVISAKGGVFGKTFLQLFMARALREKGCAVTILDEGEKPRQAFEKIYSPVKDEFDPVDVVIDTRTDEFDPMDAHPPTPYIPTPTKGDGGQVGGDHYRRLGVTPWDLIKCIEPTGIAFVDYVRGDIIAYVARLKDADKGRPAMLEKMREELLKAAHYANEAAQVIAEQLANFEKDEEQTRQGQAVFGFANRPRFTPCHIYIPEARQLEINLMDPQGFATNLLCRLNSTSMGDF